MNTVRILITIALVFLSGEAIWANPPTAFLVGVLSLQKKYAFCINVQTDSQPPYSSWVRIGERILEYEVVTFDDPTQTLFLAKGDQTLELKLVPPSKIKELRESGVTTPNVSREIAVEHIEQIIEKLRAVVPGSTKFTPYDPELEKKYSPFYQERIAKLRAKEEPKGNIVLVNDADGEPWMIVAPSIASRLPPYVANSLSEDDFLKLNAKHALACRDNATALQTPPPRKAK